MAAILFLLAAAGGLPTSYLGLCEGALKHLRAGRPLWAVSLLSAARERDPRHSLSWSLSGAAWALAGRWEEAARHASRAERLAPPSPLARFIEGLVRLRGGDFEGAREALKEASKAIRPKGGRPLALIALAELLSGDRKEAVEDSKRAAGGDPFSEAVLAWAMAKSGNWREAVRAAREALKGENPPGKGTRLDLTLLPDRSGELRPGWDIKAGRGAVEALERPAPMPPRKRVELPSGLRIAPIQPDGTLRGEVSISGVPPEASKASFVCIRIDGKIVYLSNSPPFEFLWDTRLFDDGRHEVSFVSFAEDGSVLGEMTAKVEVRNRTERPYDPSKVAELEGEAVELLASRVGFDRRALRELVVLGLRKLGRLREALSEAQALMSSGAGPNNGWVSELARELREEIERSQREKPKETFKVAAVFGPTGPKVTSPPAPSRPPPRPKVVLIFDDGPHPRATPAILDILDRYGIKATFFLTGAAVRRYPELAREIVRRGHEIGGHGYTGRRLHTLPEWEVESEVRATIEVIRKVCGVKIKLFRPPGERMNGTVRRVIEAMGLKIVPHDVEDWPCRNLPPREAAAEILRRVSEGKVILLHNGPHVPVPLIEEVVKGLIQMGYRPVGVSEFERGRP